MVQLNTNKEHPAHNAEVQDLQELSLDTLRAYRAASNKQQTAIEKADKRVSKAVKADRAKTIAKRAAGISRASNKISTKYEERRKEQYAASSAAFNDAAHKLLKDHGFTKGPESKKSSIWIKHDKATNNVHMAKLHNEKYEDGGKSKLSINSTNGIRSEAMTFNDVSPFKEKRNNSYEDHYNDHHAHIAKELDHHWQHCRNGMHSQRLNEEAQDLQELSLNTLKDYKKEAQYQKHDAETADKRASKVVKAARAKLIDKRAKGIERANKRISTAYDEIRAHNQHSSHQAFHTAAQDALKKHGYSVYSNGNKSTLFHRHDEPTNSMHFAKLVHGVPGSDDRQAHLEVISSNGTSSSHSHWPAFSTSGKKADADELHGDHFKDLDHTLTSHHKHHETGFNSRINEEVETDMINEDIELDRAEAQLVEAFEILKEGVVANLLESRGRGRPRKDGTSAVGGDREHIVMQLRKAVSLRGQHDVEFADGTKHKVPEQHARLATTIHSGLTNSIAKGNFEKKLDHSHKSFMDAISNKETAGDPPAKEDRLALRKF